MLKTKRLILRPFEEKDGQDLFEYLSDPEVVKFEPYKPFTREEAYKEAVNRSAQDCFLAVERNGKVIGNIYFARQDEYRAEIGWVLSRAYWGHGYATEAAKAVIEDAFANSKVCRIVAMLDPQNAASWRLCERLGMKREGHFIRNNYFFKDENGEPVWKDTYRYAILK